MFGIFKLNILNRLEGMYYLYTFQLQPFIFSNFLVIYKSRNVGVLSEFLLIYLRRPIEPMFIVARGRIELPTPCFSGKGKPFDLS